MSAAAGLKENFGARLAEAIDAREDGEPEDSAKLFEALFADGGGDAEAAIQYAITLLKLNRTADADRILGAALRREPDHFELNRAWANRPRHGVEFEATIARGRAFRAKFPPRAHPPAWESFAVELDCHYEMGNWDRLEDVLRDDWEELTSGPEILGDTIAALNKLFLIDRLAFLAETTPDSAWRHLPPEARANTSTKTAIATQNLAMIERTGIKIVSIGQNCLPYQLGGRWGFLGPRADPAALTPFDLGGFIHDSAADAIATDFAAFENRSNFDITAAWGGGQMFTHRPSKVGFFHERGAFWVTPDRSRFHTRLALMITNWQLALRAPQKLFVFCLCGAGSLAHLVRMVSGNLLGPTSHLLVIDVLQDAHDCPASPFVSYRHVPYPRDYEWTRVGDQCSAAGLAFETAVAEAIGWALVRLDPGVRAQLPHLRDDPNPEFPATQGARHVPPSLPARRPPYTAARRALILRGGLEIEPHLTRSLAGAELTFINHEHEIENFPDCNIFVSDLVLTHAASADAAAAFISRITSRFPVAIFFELSAHAADHLESRHMQSLHRRFDENTFMDSLNLDFVAGAAAESVYKVEHFAANPAFDSYKNWIVSSAPPYGPLHGGRGAYEIFDRPLFEISIYACHGFEALDLNLAEDLTLVEMRSQRFRAQSSGFRLGHIAHPRELGELLYHTARDARPAWRDRPISQPVLLDDHEVYRDPLHESFLAKWRAEFKIEIAELSVHELKNCVIGGTGSLFTGGRFVWGTDYLLMYLNTSSLDPVMRGLQRRHPAQHIDGVAICGFNALYDNYYHWLAEALAAISLCIDVLAPRHLPRVTIVTGKLNKLRREYLDPLLRGDKRFAVVDLARDEFITADTVIYCDNVGRAVHQQVCWEEIPMIDKLLAAAGIENARPSRRLYVARTDTAGRVMRNEQALIERLLALGFEIFVGSRHTAAEQMRAFRESKFIVGAHGAGLTNLMFCHPGTAVLELQQSGYVNTGMMRLAQLANLRYFSDVFFPAESDSFQETWLVDIERVIRSIERIDGGA